MTEIFSSNPYRFVQNLLSVFLFAFLLFSKPVLAEAVDPKLMLEGIANKITDYLKNNKDRLKKEPELAAELVRKELLPYINKKALGKGVLGKKHWQQASDEQKKTFVRAFINLVIDTYAGGLSQYSGQTFTFKATELSKNKKTARVQSEMKQSSGDPVKIDYLLRKPKGKDQWLIVDVTIEGISMRKSYRNQFSQQIQKEGLNTVIQKLVNKKIQL